MKTSLSRSLTAAATLVLTAAFPLAAAEPAPPSRSPAEIKEMAAVEQFLDLSDAELDQLLEVIARIRAMTPEQRAELRQEVAKYRQLPETQREQMRRGWGQRHPGMGPGAGWGQMPAEIRAGWRDMMHACTPEQQADILTKLQALPLDQRNAYRRQLVEQYLQARAKAK